MSQPPTDIDRAAERQRTIRRREFPRKCGKGLHDLGSNRDLTTGRQCRRCKALYAKVYDKGRPRKSKPTPSEQATAYALRPGLVERILDLDLEILREPLAWRRKELETELAAAKLALVETEGPGGRN